LLFSPSNKNQQKHKINWKKKLDDLPKGKKTPHTNFNKYLFLHHRHWTIHTLARFQYCFTHLGDASHEVISCHVPIALGRKLKPFVFEMLHVKVLLEIESLYFF